jgi:hypothetical protein
MFGLSSIPGDYGSAAGSATAGTQQPCSALVPVAALIPFTLADSHGSSWLVAFLPAQQVASERVLPRGRRQWIAFASTNTPPPMTVTRHSWRPAPWVRRSTHLFGVEDKMVSEFFTPRSSADAYRLDELLDEYCRRRGVTYIAHLSLGAVSEFVKRECRSGRVFDFCVELQIQNVMLRLDINDLSRSLRHNGAAPLSEHDAFCHRMDVLRLNSDVVFRYRAIWDKVMSVIIQLIAPHEFERFQSAKSRKKRFAKITGSSSALPAGFVDHIIRTTGDFDNLFRTPEAHGSGSTRRWVTGEAAEWDSIQADIFWAGNALNRVLLALGTTLRHQPETPPAVRDVPPDPPES